MIDGPNVTLHRPTVQQLTRYLQYYVCMHSNNLPTTYMYTEMCKAPIYIL
jgi:hypothetical protein